MTAKTNPATLIGADIRDIEYGKRKHRHWHYIYKGRRARAQSISSGQQIVLGQIIALSGSLLAGFMLELNKTSISIFAGALLLLPGIIDLAASITGAMCAKINHRLDRESSVRKVLLSSIGFSLILSLFAGLIVGLTGGLIGELFFDSTFWKILVLCQSAMLFVGMVAYPIMGTATVLIKKSGLDPDNIIGPVETGFTDALMVITISFLVRVLA